MSPKTNNANFPQFRNWLASPGPFTESPRCISRDTRQELISSIIDVIHAFYLHQDTAAQLIDRFRAHATSGRYDEIAFGPELAEAITQDLQALSGDKHFRCIFGVSPDEPGKDEQQLRLQKIHYGFGEVKILDGGIAFVEINLFAPVTWDGVRGKIQDVMQTVVPADALIIDLRKCRGGDPQTVALLASHLIRISDSDSSNDPNDSHKIWLKFVDPSTGAIEKIHTPAPPASQSFSPEKLLYILTSASTISGGEDLAYGLRARKRATVVGDTTAGAANLPRPTFLPDGFVLWVPHRYPVCPGTGGNWEGVGVKPDVLCDAEGAFEKAVKLAMEVLGVRRSNRLGV
ncbi:ClpP/crotonase-like domain-containing protein [Aspergillus heterothallicus]